MTAVFPSADKAADLSPCSGEVPTLGTETLTIRGVAVEKPVIRVKTGSVALPTMAVSPPGVIATEEGSSIPCGRGKVFIEGLGLERSRICVMVFDPRFETMEIIPSADRATPKGSVALPGRGRLVNETGSVLIPENRLIPPEWEIKPTEEEKEETAWLNWARGLPRESEIAPGVYRTKRGW
jgi:hypothetical protein